MNFAYQLNQVSRLARTSLTAGAVALVCLGAYGAYRYLSKDKVGAAPEPKKEKSDDSRSPETNAATEPAAEAADTAANHGSDPEVARPVPDTQAEDQVALTPEQQFFHSVWDLAEQVPCEKAWIESVHAIHVAKFRTSKPRKTVVNGVRTIIFPVGPGLNVILNALSTSSNDVYFTVNGDKKRHHVHLVLAEQSNPLVVSPENQAKSYVFEKGMELINVGNRVIHPLYAYPMDFDSERGLATNFELKGLDAEKANLFFNKVFDNAEKASVFPYTRSDMAYISSAINAGTVSEVIRFANLEGDRFMHIVDYSQGLTNLVLVQRAQGYVQLFRAEKEAKAEFTTLSGFEQWLCPVGAIFDMNNQEHLEIAAFISPDTAREVMSDPVQPNDTAAAA